MSKSANEVDAYLAALSGDAQQWLRFFVQYMRDNHAELDEVISFKMPTYKLGSGKLRNYIAFCPAKRHLSMHTMDFAYIEQLKGRLASPGNGKGCVHVKYNNPAERAILLEGIEEIIRRKVMAVYGK